MNLDSRQLIDFFDRSMAVSFYALIFFLPISNALVETFTVLILLFYLTKRSLIFARRVREEKFPGLRPVVVMFLSCFEPPANALNHPIMIWMGVCLFSIVISERPDLSFHGFLGKVLQNAFLFFNFVEAIRTKERVNYFLLSFIMSAFFICLSGINQYVLHMDFIRNHILQQHRINSTFRAPNDFAAYLVIVIPLLMSFFAYSEKPKGPAGVSHENRIRLSVILMTLLAVICLGLTYSRGGWLSLGVALGMFSIFNWHFFKKVLIGIIGFMGIFMVKMIKEREFMDFHNMFASFGRMTYWHEALRMIADKPIFGFGLNTYSIIGRRYKESWGGYPHNCYLQMTAELGIVGLCSFLWILINLYRVVFQAIKAAGDPQQRALLIGAATGLGAFLIHSGFDTFFYSVQLSALMWMMMGLLISLVSIEET